MNKDAFDDKTICLSYTCKSKEVCIDRGITNAHTFASFFGESNDQINKALKSLKQYDKIHVDEYSMAPNLFYRLLLKAKRMHPHLRFNLFGDINQCIPPESIFFDYIKSKLIMELVDYNLMTLSYKNTRYDGNTYNELDYFIKNKTLPDICKETVLLDKSYTNICYLNTTRTKINNECMVRYCKEFNKQIIYLDGFDVAEGIPVVVEGDNDHINKLYNSNMYTLKKIKDNIVEIEREKEGKIETKEISHETFRKYFNYGFCCTVYKYQGDTIKKPYNI